MADPQRWLDADSDASELERELLSHEIEQAPDPSLAQGVWRSISGSLPGGDGGDGGAPQGGEPSGGGGVDALGAAASASAAAASGAAKIGALTIAKSFVIGATAGGVLFGSAAAVHERLQPTAAQPRTAASVATYIESRRAASTVDTARPSPPALEPPADRGPGFAMPAAGGEPTRAAADTGAQPSSASFAPLDGERTKQVPGGSDRLERELLQQARLALRKGDAQAALHWVARARGEFTNGTLAQEREVLAVEALSAAGRRAEAAEKARTFLRSFPESPHATHMLKFAAAE